MQAGKFNPGPGKKGKFLLIIDTITINLHIILKKILDEFSYRDDINDYTLDPKQFREYIKTEIDKLINFFQSGEIHLAAAQGMQAAIEGMTGSFKRRGGKQKI